MRGGGGRNACGGRGGGFFWGGEAGRWQAWGEVGGGAGLWVWWMRRKGVLLSGGGINLVFARK